ncbi:MAG: hypothetical protein H7175_16390 [Burkholderiales bacterium]|nr:hypothetical protein [Anaerolineae bacterium]
MRHSCRLIPAALLLLWAWTAPISSAQSGNESAPETCSALMAAALSQASSSCSNLEHDTACFAYDNVTATFATDNSPNGDDLAAENEPEFNEPGDTIATATLENFSTSAPDLPQSTLGFGILNIQADLPISLPESVHMMLIGAAQIENGVPPNRALQLPQSPLEVRVSSETNLHNIPDNDAPVVGQVSAGTLLQADGVSANSLWLRVYFPNTSRVTAWVSRSWLEADLDTASLPIITPESHSPMQRFFLSTETPVSTCIDEEDAAQLPPSLLLVQGPSGTEITLTVNEVNVSTEATMAMQSDLENGLRIFALDGDVRVFPDTPEEVTVPSGSFIAFCQEGELDLGIDDEGDDFRVSGDCAMGGVIQQCYLANEVGLERLSLLPTILLNKPVTIPPQCFTATISTGEEPEFVEICVPADGIGTAGCVMMSVRYRPDLIDPQTGRPVILPPNDSTAGE